MRITNHEDMPANEVTMEGAHDCRVRWLIGEKESAPTFAMREFEVSPGGHTPKHFHDYEHEVYVLAGDGHDRRWRQGAAAVGGRRGVRRAERRASVSQHGERADAISVLDSEFGDGRESVTVVPECGLEPKSC